MKESNSIQYHFRQTSAVARKYVLLAVLLSPVLSKAQRQRVYVNMLWLGHYSTVQLSNRFSLNSDVQVRAKDWAQKWSQQLVRSGISYKVSPKLSVTAGGAWFRHAQYIGESLVYRNEYRPWQEASFGTQWGKLGVMQRMRLEERVMQKMVSGRKTNSYDYITRLRYRLELQLPLKGPKLTTSLINEFMVNPGHWGREKFLDQNRTFVGFNLKVSGSTMLQAQYMKLFQWRTSNLLEKQNVIRFNIHQQFNRKK